MTLLLDATPVGISANSYLDATAADAVFEGMLGAAPWFALTSPEKEQALVAATSRLDKESYFGIPILLAQALSWPRYGLWDQDGRPFPVDVIPPIVKRACCEQVLFMLAATAAQTVENTAATGGLGSFKTLTVGPITIEPAVLKRAAVASAAAEAGTLAPAVGRLLGRYLRDGVPGSVHLRREDD